MIGNKKVKICLGLAVGFVLTGLSAQNSFAAQKTVFTTQEGYVLTKEQYDKVSQMYSDDSLYVQDRATIDNLLQEDVEIVRGETLYVQVDELYDAAGNYLGEYEREITKKEADVLERKLEANGNQPIVSRDFSTISSLVSKQRVATLASGDKDPRPNVCETNMKILKISGSKSNASSAKNIVLELKWTAMPKTRSFDVIAIRPGVECSFFSTKSDPNLECRQSYTVNGVSKTVTYNAYGDHCVKKLGAGISGGHKMDGLKHGCGFSMNLVNDATAITCTMEMNVLCSKKSFVAYGSYQHAQKSVTLAKSKKYKISTSGYGRVILFDDAVKQNYDNMPGVSIAL